MDLVPLEVHEQALSGDQHDPLAQPDGGEGGLDRVGGAQVDPVLGGEVVEGEQRVEVVGDLGGKQRPLLRQASISAPTVAMRGVSQGHPAHW